MILLFIGDVVGQPGRRVIANQLPALRQRLKLDLVVANAENIADGAGITKKTANELFAAGVDVLTNGNHAWDKKEAFEYITTEPRLLRPHNYPAGTPGTGWFVATTHAGHAVGILNLMGNVFMHPHLACPFAAAEHVLTTKPKEVKMVLVDLHAEVTSEKMAMGWYLDGRVSAVVGTHTHVPTADERLLPQGTGYITDVGMTGCYESVIGMETQKSLKRFVQKLPEHFEVAEGIGTICGVLVDINEQTGLCRSISRLRVSEAVAQTTIKVA
ncbi:MAG: TIGR00282 family metallophosphoesterase [Sulfuricaulis sp.]